MKPEQVTWAVYCNVYALVTQQLVEGAGDEQVRRVYGIAEDRSNIVRDLEARSPWESEIYATTCQRGMEDALAGRPPNCGPFGFGSEADV